MRKIKYLIFTLIISGSLFFIFGPEILPENLQFQQALDSTLIDRDVIIIFNSGGWGNTPLEEAEDFAPAIKGIEKTLDSWGYRSVVIPYKRTKDGLLGKFWGIKDSFSSFRFSSENLAEKVEFLIENLPDKKIIIAGLSNGASLVDESMEKISTNTQNSVYAIVAGIPFWSEPYESENILHLSNNKKDTLSTGEVKSLVFSLIKAPFVWIEARINGQNLPFSKAIQVPGHNYFWSSPEVGPEIVTFLEDKFH